MKHWALPGWSLRTKLVVACALVQLAAAAALILGSERLLQRTLTEQATAHVSQLVTILDETIAVPLAQRDYATLQQTLERLRSEGTINYLVLSDHRGKLIGASGWDTTKPLPPRDGDGMDLDRADGILHVGAPLVVAGQRLGRLDLGISMAGLKQARATFRRRSLGIAGLGLALSVALLAAISLLITRHLTALTLASRQVAAGYFDVHMPTTSNDEIGRLGESFNVMAATLKHRMAALTESEGHQRRHLLAAREEQSRLTTLLGAMGSGILFVDARCQVIYANKQFAELWHLPALEPGTTLTDIVPAITRQSQSQAAEPIGMMLDPGVSPAEALVELHTLDGRIISQRMEPVTEGTTRSGCIWFHKDITQERKIEQRAQQALHDPLTGLFNRRAFFESLQAAVALARLEGSELTLMFVDLDGFKSVNDLAGHKTGDRLLVDVARALSGQLRAGQIIARFGGDEFAILCPGMGSQTSAGIAKRLIAAVSRAGSQPGAAHPPVGCSVGLATYPQDALLEEDLVACADSAMYLAKHKGKNRWERFRGEVAQAPLAT